MALTIYRHLLRRFPVGSQAVQTGFLMGLGDLLAQTIAEKKSLKEIDAIRTGQFALVGTLFVGPPLRIWYGAMDNFFGGKGKITALKKVAADQLIFAPVFIVVIMGIVNAVRGKSLKETREQIARDYPDILVTNYKLWPAVQLINFYLVPLSFQVITVQVIAIFWNMYLSWKMNRIVKDQP